MIEADVLADLSLSQIDRQLFLEVKQKAGAFDKNRFCKTLDRLYKSDVDELIHVRKGLYEEARRCDNSLQYGTLVKRTNSERSSASEKLLDDIYVIYKIIDGAYSPAEIKQVLCYKDRQQSTNGLEMDTTVTTNEPDDEEQAFDESETSRQLNDSTCNIPESNMSNIVQLLLGMRLELLEKINDISEVNTIESVKLDQLTNM